VKTQTWHRVVVFLRDLKKSSLKNQRSRALHWQNRCSSPLQFTAYDNSPCRNVLERKPEYYFGTDPSETKDGVRAWAEAGAEVETSSTRHILVQPHVLHKLVEDEAILESNVHV
jgi:hypothetical protein